MTSKAERIRTLLDEGILSTQEIADRIGCLPEYVRSVKQRRDPNSWHGKASRTGNREAARIDARIAYHRALQDGKSEGQAGGLYARAYRRTLARTRGI